MGEYFVTLVTQQPFCLPLGTPGLCRIHELFVVDGGDDPFVYIYFRCIHV